MWDAACVLRVAGRISSGNCCDFRFGRQQADNQSFPEQTEPLMDGKVSSAAEAGEVVVVAPPSVDDLPAAATFRILQFVAAGVPKTGDPQPAMDLASLCAAACTSTGWRDAARDPRLWRRLGPFPRALRPKVDDARIALLIRRAGGELDSLDVSCCPNVTAHGLLAAIEGQGALLSTLSVSGVFAPTAVPPRSEVASGQRVKASPSTRAEAKALIARLRALLRPGGELDVAAGSGICTSRSGRGANRRRCAQLAARVLCAECGELRCSLCLEAHAAVAKSWRQRPSPCCEHVCSGCLYGAEDVRRLTHGGGLAVCELCDEEDGVAEPGYFCEECHIMCGVCNSTACPHCANKHYSDCCGQGCSYPKPTKLRICGNGVTYDGCLTWQCKVCMQAYCSECYDNDMIMYDDSRGDPHEPETWDYVCRWGRDECNDRARAAGRPVLLASDRLLLLREAEDEGYDPYGSEEEEFEGDFGGGDLSDHPFFAHRGGGSFGSTGGFPSGYPFFFAGGGDSDFFNRGWMGALGRPSAAAPVGGQSAAAAAAEAAPPQQQPAVPLGLGGAALPVRRRRGA